MIRRIIYEAFDGMSFTTCIECICHDIKVLEDELQFFDENGKRIHCPESAKTIEEFMFKIFKVKTGGARAKNLLCEILKYCDYERLLDIVVESPYDEDTYYYDKDEDEWYSEKIGT